MQKENRQDRLEKSCNMLKNLERKRGMKSSKGNFKFVSSASWLVVAATNF